MTAAAQLELADASQLCKALGDEARLRIVAILSHGELCVCHLEKALALPQPTVSRHLAVLRAAELVEGRRSGSWIHYRLTRQTDPVRKHLLASLSARFSKEHGLKRELARLVRGLGPSACK
jgi:ArsR family transcriptional regulator